MKQVFFFFLLPFVLHGQPREIRIMHYNLLFYGHVTSFCTPYNNNQDTKDSALRQVINYVNPHIFTANEVGNNYAARVRLDQQVMNAQGRHYYSRAPLKDSLSSSIGNALFYDNRVFGLARQQSINTPPRIADVYTLYYKNPQLPYTHDTIFLHCIVVHLKAGTQNWDHILRDSATKMIMDHLQNNMPPGKYLFMGDLNVKSSQEQAYQNIVDFNSTHFRFYDPIDQPGHWYDNPDFAHVHTQSPRLYSNGCAVGGGMDDRYDFILVSGKIKYMHGFFRYKKGSYKAIGNDGMHFKQALDQGINNSIPSHILDALMTVSDHLPVKMTLIAEIPSSVSDPMKLPQVSISNPVTDKLHYYVMPSKEKVTGYSLFSSGGSLVISANVMENKGVIDVSSLSYGVYILEISFKNSPPVRKKIIKNG